MYKKLFLKMYENDDNITSLSKKTQINKDTLSKKLNAKFQFKANEIRKISDVYNLSNEEIVIFFNLRTT
ncbi:hypothetical protein EII29_02585 [Leptotrichia sp. OH3620_COT-345]|uniref:helix-turn-helix domain-containing protein n=1 Tax=Leptotrichia sp. OH3620_COT-345 TaxID=2491048 RepID=UPI000F64C9CD|nr:helix-turn-helix domain-containing protein [Leptotrichia sp. OH3620_COT-345]RRD40385.1 hypothetical protein EII29_02585 [Leptotrichia sp. OH3620_COT-345]